jgi:hypothetical protein
MSEEEPVPEIIFIVPYRDRENQKGLFIRQMAYLLEDIPSDKYKIYFSEQCDQRDFNRGAMKNIGFLAMKNRYPNDYKNITFVFNDVDTMPYRKGIIDYKTTPNVVKHFYGYTYTLGGIVSILGGDFERTLGYPNLWAWGFEDNSLQKRVIANGIHIDRSVFFKMGDNEIIQMVDEVFKKVNRNEFERYMDNTNDGIHTIQSLDYVIDDERMTINVNGFNTPYENVPSGNTLFDVTTSSVPFRRHRRLRNAAMKMFL